jgi:HK97 family phage portal protein
MANILERAALMAGRIKGTYERALKSATGPAPLMDPTAWTGLPIWGEAVALGMTKPGNKADIAKWFTSWAYICVRTNADARAAVPTGLFVAAESKGKAWRTISTSPRSLTRQRRKHIESRADLRRYLVKSEDVEEVAEHRYLDLMKRPNPYQSETDLKWLTSAFMDLCGEAYWYVGVKDGLGVPVQVWTIPAPYIKPIPGKSLEEYVVGYEYKRGNVRQTLPVEDVIHFRNPNPLNEYVGFSTLRGVADALYVNYKMAEFESAMFENKARPGGIFTSEAGMSTPALDRAAAQIQEKYAGARQAGKSMMLPPGIKFLPDSMTPNELSFLEGKKTTALEICAGFGCPYSLFDPNAIRANVEGAQYSHAKYGVQPWLTRYDDTLNGDLMLMYDPEGKLFVASDNPVPEDKAYLLQKRTADIAAGVSTINEERADDGKEPIEGADEPLVSSLLVPLSQAVRDEPEPQPAPVNMPVPGQQGGKPKPGQGEDEAEGGDLDTGAGVAGGKAVDRLAGLVLAKVKERLGGHA